MFPHWQWKVREAAYWLGSFPIFHRALSPGAGIGQDELRLGVADRTAGGASGRAGQLGDGTSPFNLEAAPTARQSSNVGQLGDAAVKRPRPGSRCLLWIDAVGGFLLCLDDEVLFGQAIPGSEADVPIFGDLSRRHMVIRRAGEGYLVQAQSLVCVEGRHVQGAAMLSDGDEIQMGASVRLRFRQPHPMSMTARLEFLSHHGTQPSADAILLMADACILGPGAQNHVVCRDWSGEVMLFRAADGQLHCRAEGLLQIDGKTVGGDGPITRSSRVTGNDFALCLEEL